MYQDDNYDSGGKSEVVLTLMANMYWECLFIVYRHYYTCRFDV